MRTQLNYEITYAYLNRMAARIEEYPGYSPSTPVYILNENASGGNHIELFAGKNSLSSSKADALFSAVDDKISVLNKYTFVTNTLDVQDFITFYLGIPMNIITDGEQMDAVRNLPAFQEMGLYPDGSGMLMIDNILIIKLPG